MTQEEYELYKLTKPSFKLNENFSTEAKHRDPVETLVLGRNGILGGGVTPEETRLVAVFNVTDTSEPTSIMHSKAISQFTEIEIDGVVQPSVVSSYQFDTTGEHTVKYTLKDKTSIGEIAFAECNSLISITIPNSVTSIGTTAFTHCFNLTNITIGNGVTSIGTAAFQACNSLTKIIIPNNVKNLGMAAFFNCIGLISVEIGNGITSFGGQTFQGCSNLSTITSHIMNAPSAPSGTFVNVKSDGTLYVPTGSSGYETWMNDQGNLGQYNWTKVEQ